MTRRRYRPSQGALDECIEDLITQGVIDGPQRPFAKLTRREQGLVNAAYRLARLERAVRPISNSAWLPPSARRVEREQA